MTVLPPTRDRAVQGMFDHVAPRYDILNRIISFRFDRYWRKHVVAAALQKDAALILDLGTGTGDLAFDAATRGGARTRVIGLDFSLPMLRIAVQKRASAPQHADVPFVQGSALYAPFKSEAFDAVMTAFVLRNISDLDLFFSESYRVLKPGGSLVSLDMFPPPRNWFGKLFSFYFFGVVPWIGKALSPNAQAYRYLSESVRQFCSPEAIAALIESSGFIDLRLRKFLNGTVCLHIVKKPETGSL